MKHMQECLQRTLDLQTPTGDPQDCIDDIIDFAEEISYNLAFGGNDRTWDMSNLYVTGAHVAR